MPEGYLYQKVEEKHGTIFREGEQYAVAEIDKPITQVLEQLRSQIERGEYKIVIGDDASGRIPALIIAGAMKKIYASRGIPAPLIRFVAGSRFIEDAELSRKKWLLSDYARDMKEYLLSQGEKSLKKIPHVLIVTDFVESGRSIKPLVEALKVSGVRADIVTVGVASGFNERQATFNLRASGQQSVPGIFRKKGLSGVIKSPKELFATKAYDTIEGQKKVNATREMVADIASRVSEEFMSGVVRTS